MTTPRYTLRAQPLALLIGLFVLTAAACSAGPGDSSAPSSTSTTVAPTSTTVAPTSTAAPTTTLAPPPSMEGELDVMSFNIRYDNPDDDPNWSQRFDPIIEMLRERRPDVIGIQEGLDHQVAQLAEALPDYAWVGVGRDDGEQGGEYAAIFYRSDVLEVSDWGTWWLSDTPDEPSIGWDAVLPRVATWTQLRPLAGGPDDEILVINTHFDHEGVIARERSAELIADRLDPQAGPAIVMGDLNVLPDDPALAALTNTTIDARLAAPITDTIGSFNAFLTPDGLWNIDYILTIGAPPLQFETIDDDYGVTYISDHFPIIATVDCSICP